jgi:hypothetical protein
MLLPCSGPRIGSIVERGRSVAMSRGLQAGIITAAVVIIGLFILRVRWKAASPRPEAPGSSPIVNSVPAGIENLVRENIVRIAETQFPDNRGLRWLIHGFSRLGSLVVVEVEPQPSEVGYSRFKFVFVVDGGAHLRHVATYCLEAGEYSLLSTSPDAPVGLPKRLN